MNVLLINGSPHEKGCTYTALSLIAGELNKAGIDTEILHVGGKPVGGCIGGQLRQNAVDLRLFLGL